MQTETLVNTMQYSLPEVTLRDMDGNASVNTLVHRVGEVNADEGCKTVTDVIGASVVC